MNKTPFPGRFSKGRVVATALVALLSCTAAGGTYALQATQNRQVVIAQFRDVSPMLVGNDVKLHGVKVGEVAGMTEHDGIASVALDLGPDALPLHTDAKATVRPVSLLGERYMDLETGSANAPLLPAGGVIPISQTGQNADLDQLLNTFDDKTGQSLAAFVAVLGEGMRGNGADLDAAGKALAPAMTNTDQFVHVLQQQNSVLNSLIENVEPVTNSLAQDNGKTLDGLINSTTSLMNTTSTNVQALNESLDELPSTLVAARGTLGNLADTAENAGPLLHDIRPTTDKLRDISDELVDFSHDADPALRKTVPLLHKGKRMLEDLRPVAEDLRDAGPDIVDTARALDPTVRQLSHNINDVLNFIRFWALTTNAKDGLTHYFRAHINAGPLSLTGNLPAGPLNPGSASLGGPDIAPQSGQPKNTSPLQSPVAGMLEKSTSKDGGVTGMNQKQESGALGFLMGGDN
jgi:phospholipid/cholesterol/gamma-HCH transport system substrate-binding protein